MREGKPFEIKGVAGHENIELLAQIGGNTIRTYDTTDLSAILNKAHELDLATVVGIHLPKTNEDWFYENDSLIESFNNDLQAFVKRYKSHPSVLLWCLANEPFNYDLADFTFPRAYNKFLQTIKHEDPNHPVAMAIPNFSERSILNIQLKIPELDIIMINTFGELSQLEEKSKMYELIWDGPFIVGEFGIHGYWESPNTSWGSPLELTSNQKAFQLDHSFKILPRSNPRFLGSFFFYWGQKNEYTPTWFGTFHNGLINDMVFSLAREFGNPIHGNTPPQIQRLLINNSNSSSEHIFKPNSQQVASIQVHDTEGDSLSITWSLKMENWTNNKEVLPDLPISTSRNNPILSFSTPGRAGAYRLYVMVTDHQGNFSSANLPFYVVR